METTRPAPQGMRVFLWIWAGELISIIGSGLSSFALGVWIFQKTGQATPFAMTVLFATLPRLILMPLAGMLADRWNRRLLMILGDAGSALVTVVMAALLWMDRLDIGVIYLLAALSSSFTTFQEPAYRASVTMLVPRKDLARASGLMNASEALQMLLAPLMAGFLFGAVGLAGILIIDFVTFFFAVGVLLVVRIPQPKMTEAEAEKKPSLWADTAFAWRYLRARPGLFWLIWYFALVNFILNISAVLTGPLVLSFTGPDVYGLIQVALGAGMLAGSVVIGVWGGPKRQVAGVVGFLTLSAIGVFVAGLRPSPLLIGSGLFVMLFFIPMAQACSTAIQQAKTEPSVQGRLFALRGVISQSILPLAFLLAGPLADRVFNPWMQPDGALGAGVLGQILGAGPGRGVGLMFVISGVLLVAASAAAWSSPRIRRISEELPDAAPEAVSVETADPAVGTELPAAP
jgi:MFS family permease